MNTKSKRYSALFVGLATFFIYLPALRNQFVGVWDDNMYVFENMHIRAFDAAFFRWAFLDFYASNWHPLTWISHAVDYAFWGLNPLGHHLTSIILHSVNAFLVVVLAVRLLQMARERGGGNIPEFPDNRAIMISAGVTGLLFGIHPLHVESVAWAAERKDVLCGLFFLLSLIAYTKYAAQAEGTGHHAESGNTKAPNRLAFFTDGRYLASLMLFALALLSKPMAVSLPFVLLILDWYPLGRIHNIKTSLSAGIEKLPFLAFSLGSSIITVLAQESGESILLPDSASLPTRLLVAAKSLSLYLGNMILPSKLAAFYPYPKDVRVFSSGYLLAVFLFVAISASCILRIRKRKLWLAAWGFYIVTLIPVIGLVQTGNQSMADRYTYLPSLGPFLVVGICVSWIDNRIRILRAGALAQWALAGGIVLLVSLSSATIVQIGQWKNDFVLWNAAIGKGYASATAYNNRGLSLDNRGLPEKAAADFEKAIEIDPRNYFAYNNRGVLFGSAGRYAESIEYFKKAIAINARHADSYCNLGLSYFSQKQYASSLENYNKAIDLKEDFDAAYLDRGNLYFVTGDQYRALQDYRKACGLGNKKACEAFYLASRSLNDR